MGSLTKEGAGVAQLQAQVLCKAGVFGALPHAVALSQVCSSGRGSRGSSITKAQCEQQQGQTCRAAEGIWPGHLQGLRESTQQWRAKCICLTDSPPLTNPSCLPPPHPPILTPPLQKAWKKRHMPVSGLRSSPCSGASSTCGRAEAVQVR